MAELVTTELQVVEDLRRMLERLDRVGAPEVRIVSDGRGISVFGSTHSPVSLTDASPLVLVRRGFEWQPHRTEPIDTVVELRAVLDRMPRLTDAPYELTLPPVERTALWAGVLPPREGWIVNAHIAAASLAAVARQGAERVQSLLPDNPGQALVERVRTEVWSLPMVPGIPAAAAFALDSMGFLQGEAPVRVATTNIWTRLSTDHGDVIVRRR